MHHVRRRAWSGLPPPAILSSAATTRSSSTSGCVAALTATHGITSLRMPALAAIATLATAATIAAALTAALAAHRSLATAPLPPLLSPHMPSAPDACRCRAPTPSSFSGRLPSGWTFLGRAQPAAVKTTAKTAAVSAAALPIAAETAALPAAVSTEIFAVKVGDSIS